MAGSDWLAEDLEPLTPAETYQSLLRSLQRRTGFNLLFVHCSPVQAEQIIADLQRDLPQKKSATLTVQADCEHRYDQCGITLRDAATGLSFLFSLGQAGVVALSDEA